jgi:hypothetical protein
MADGDRRVARPAGEAPMADRRSTWGREARQALESGDWRSARLPTLTGGRRTSQGRQALDWRAPQGHDLSREIMAKAVYFQRIIIGAETCGRGR